MAARAANDGRAQIGRPSRATWLILGFIFAVACSGSEAQWTDHRIEALQPIRRGVVEIIIEDFVDRPASTRMYVRDQTTGRRLLIEDDGFKRRFHSGDEVDLSTGQILRAGSGERPLVGPLVKR